MVTDDFPTLAPWRRALHVRFLGILDRPNPVAGPDRTSLFAAGLIGFACLLHLAYLAFACPFDLAPDEAHYWQWSRHLDIAYYSKGPLIAWLIRGSCELFGSLSVQLTGTEVLAVRLPAVMCHAALLWGVFVLTAETLGRRPALGVIALALTVPPLTAGAILMTIDAPFLVCWAWTLVYVRRATEVGRTRDWILAGVFCGLGLLAKFSMLLLPGVLLLYLAMDRERWSHLRRPGLWGMFALIALAAVPLVEWNLRHGWLEVRHVTRQIGGKGSSLLTTFAFLGGQFGFLIGYWFLAFLAVAVAWRPSSRVLLEGYSLGGRTPPARRGVEFLWYFSVPVWLVFLFASTRTAGQVNWPAASYVAGFPLAAAWVFRQIRDPAPRYRRFARGCLALGVVMGTVLTLAAHFPGTMMRPVLACVVEPATRENPTPLRRLDPTCRLQGWSVLAREVDAIRDRVRLETGNDPVLTGMVWTVPGELCFYCGGHPEAYSLGSALADRHSQYDVWRPNPVADAQVFQGRTFVYVGDEIPGMAGVFDRVEPPRRLVYAEDGQTLTTWTIWVAHGFRGFRDVMHRGDY